MKAPIPVQIFSEGGRVVVNGVGRNKAFSLKLQYSIQEKKSGVFSILTAVLVVGGILLFAGLFAFFLKKKSSRDAVLNRSSLTERQLAIVKIVEEHGVVSQKSLEEALGIPKSSVSRNVNALVKKGVLRKERKGLTNVLFLAKAS